MTNFFSLFGLLLGRRPARATRPRQAFGLPVLLLLLALLPLLAQAAPPVLRFEATATATANVTAFVDQVEIIDVVTALPVRGVVPNAGFETSGPLSNTDYGYRPGGASWDFVSNSGIAANGSGFNNPTAPEGSRVAFLQTVSGAPGYFSQTLANLLPGLYKVRIRVAQRNTLPANQGVRILIDGVALGSVVPTSTSAFTTYTSAAFTVARLTTSPQFAAAAGLTVNGAALDVGDSASPEVTDLDGDGLLDLVMGSDNGLVQRYEQTAANALTFATASLTVNGAALAVRPGASPVVTDLDGNGRLDLLVGTIDGNVRRFEQTAVNASTFGSGVDLITSGGGTLSVGTYASPLVTDLDGNGLLDLLVGNEAGTVTRYEQTATPTAFTRIGDLATSSGTVLDVGGYSKPTLTDLDGDGLLDLLVGNDYLDTNPYDNITSSNVLRFEQATSNGTAFNPVSDLTTFVQFRADPTVADLDRDGRLDLLLGTTTGNVARFEQASAPTALALSPRTVAENAVVGTVVGTFTSTDDNPGDTFTYSLVAGAGSTDNALFAAGSGANAGKLVTNSVFDYETKNSYSVRVRTTDNAGLFFEQDFVINITDVGNELLITSFSPANGPPGTLVTITGQNLAGVTGVLMDAVPLQFTVVSNTSITATIPRTATTQRLRVSRAAGSGVETSVSLSATAFQVTRPSTSTIFAPLPDLQETYGGRIEQLNLARNNTGTRTTYAAPVVTDMDNDGLLDLLVGNDYGSVDRYEQTAVNGNVFNVQTGGAFNQFNNDDYRLAAPAVTDLDGNGLLDLLVGTYGGKVMRFQQSAPNGGFGAAGQLTTDGSTPLNAGRSLSPTVTDLDGNGRLDLLLGNADGYVKRFEQTALNGIQFAPMADLTTDGSTPIFVPERLARPYITDIDNDGLLDLLVRSGGGVVKRYEQTTANGIQFALVGNLTTDGTTALQTENTAPAITDVDGDGLLDLLASYSGYNGVYFTAVKRYEQADPPNSLSISAQQVAENAPEGTLVGTFTSTDSNVGDTFSYSLVAGPGSVGNGQFYIDGNQLKAYAGIDYETQNQYRVRVRTTDNTGLFFEQTFIISVTDVVEIELTSFAPTSGPLGTTVTLQGRNLTSLTSVLVGAVPARFAVATNGNSATAVVPRQAVNQRLRISRTGPDAGNNYPGTVLSAAAFAVTRPITNPAFAGGTLLTTNGSDPVNVGSLAGAAATDIDGNGRLDLLVGGTDGNGNGSMARYEQTAVNAGTFAFVGPFVDDDVQPNARPVVTDLDGNGRLDLLTGTADGRVSRYEQTAVNSSTFARVSYFFSRYLYNNSTSQFLDVGDNSAPTVTDLDNNGLVDLLVGAQDGTVTRYEQDGPNSIRFNASTRLMDASAQPLDVGDAAVPTITDLDGDGLLDMLVGNAAGLVTRYEQTAANSFTFNNLGTLTSIGGTLTAGLNAAPMVTDVDGDGVLDLLVGNAAGNVARFEQAAPPTALALTPRAVAENAAIGTAVGTFAPTDSNENDAFTYSLVTGAGGTDNAQFAISSNQLLTNAVFDYETRNSYTVRVRVTDANGSFVEQFFTISITDLLEPPLLTSFSPASGPLGTTVTITGQALTGLTSVLVGGVPAIFTVTNPTSATAVIPRQAVNQRLRISRTGTGVTTNDFGTALSAAAFQVTRPSASAVFMGGNPLTNSSNASLNAGGNAALTVTDLDNDGLLDLLSGDGNGNVLRFEQTAANAATFNQLGYLTTTGTTRLGVGYNSTPTVTDLDGNGLLDLLVGENGGTIQRYEQTARNGTAFTARGALTNGTANLAPGLYPAPTVTDVDNNGLLDLLVGNAAGNVVRYEQTAANTATFNLINTLTTNGTALLDAGDFVMPAVTDVDGNGRLDLLLGNLSGPVQRYEQTAANGGTFAFVSNLTTNGTAALNPGGNSTVAVTDLDGDGLLDLLASNGNGPLTRYEQTDPPLTLTLTPQAVAENAAVGTVVGTFASTTGTGQNTAYTYTLVTGVGSTDNAQFAIGSGANAGKLVTTAVFDYETKPSYSVRVRTTDANGGFFEQFFTISITDLTDAPLLTSFTPASGPLGTTVTLTGQALTGLTSVLVGGVPADFTVTNATTATAVIPRQALNQRLRVSRAGAGVTANDFGTALSSASFQVTRPSASTVFMGGNLLLTQASANAPTVTDLDYDGLLDVLVGGNLGTIVRYEQTVANGTTFAQLGALMTSSGVLNAGNQAAPAVTDLDGDGLLDLLVSTGSGSIYNYEQTAANGAVFNLIGQLNGYYTNFAVLTVTDVDNNGLLDLLVGRYDGQVVRAEQTAPNSTNFAPQPLTTDGTNALDVGDYAAPTVSDPDGDGLLDLLVGNFNGTVTRYEQTAANGSAFALVGDLVGNGGMALNVGRRAAPTVTDLDGDGLLDLLVNSNDGNGNIYRFEQTDPSVMLALTPPAVDENKAIGTVVGTFAVTGTGQNTAYTYTLVAGPGSTDNARFAIGSGANAGKLVTNAVFDYETKNSYSVRVRATDASGSLFEQVLTVGINDLVELALAGFTPGSGPLGTTVTLTGQDLTGLTSVLVGSVPAAFTVASSTTVTAVIPRQAVNQRLRVSRTGTGAGTYDLGTDLSQTAFQVTRPSTSAVFGGGDNLTTDGTTALNGDGFAASAVTDVDNDGLLDLLVGTNDGYVRRYEQRTANDGAFALLGALTTDGTTPLDAGSNAAPTVTDLDGDGLLDLLVGDNDGYVQRYEQTTANGSIFAPQGLLMTDSNAAISVADIARPTVTDVDNDGLLDLLVGNFDGFVTRFEQTAANGSVFAGRGRLTTDGSTEISGGYFSAPTITDMDGDGLLDLLVGTEYGTVDRYEQTVPNGGAFAPLGSLTVNGTYALKAGYDASPTVTDVDGDGLLDLLVANGDGDVLRYEQLAPPPTIVSFTPTSGPVGTTISLTGTNLGGATAITFVGSSTTVTTRAFTVVSATSITGVVVPFGASTGPLTVTTASGTSALSAQSFTVTTPPLALTSLSAAAELPGQAVVLTGTGFTAASTVTIGGVAATTTYRSPTALSAVVPVGAAAGNATVVVTSNGSSTSSSPAFEVLQVYRSATASGCLATASVSLTGTGGAGTWRYLRLPGAGGAVVAAIEDTRNLGTVSAGFTVLGTGTASPVRRDPSNRAYLDRNFYLTATNPAFANQTVRVRFFGLSSELDRLKAVDANATLAGLKASQYSGPNENCDLADNAATGEKRLLAAPATVLAGTDWFTAELAVADHFSEFYLTGAAAPLPVELLSFTAEKRGTTVALAWATASEKNADRFEVERSRDGRSFERIGQVAAAGSSTSRHAYDFLDAKYPGETDRLYYRLRQVDRDGTFSYSPVRTVQVGGPATLALFPNPTRGAATLTGATPGTVVRVYDALGREVLAATADAAGTAALVLPAGHATGVYVVRVGSKVLRLTVE